MMSVIYSQTEMDNYLKNVVVSNDYPVISKFITGAKEIEVDAVADKGSLKQRLFLNTLKMREFTLVMQLLFYHQKI